MHRICWHRIHWWAQDMHEIGRQKIHTGYVTTGYVGIENVAQDR